MYLHTHRGDNKHEAGRVATLFEIRSDLVTVEALPQDKETAFENMQLNSDEVSGDIGGR